MLQVGQALRVKLREGSGSERAGQLDGGRGLGCILCPQWGCALWIPGSWLQGGPGGFVWWPGAFFPGLPCGLAPGGSFHTAFSGAFWNCAARGNVHRRKGAPGAVDHAVLVSPCLPLSPCLHAASRPAAEGPEAILPRHPACSHMGRKLLLGWPKNTHRGREGLAGPQEAGAAQGGAPCSGEEDQEALGHRPGSCGPFCPPAPHAPTHVWAPRQGTRSFLCAGARLAEKRPPVWEPGRRARSRGSCSEQRSGFFSNPQQAAVPAVQPSRSWYFALPWHLSLSSLSTLPTPTEGRRAGSRQARPGVEWGPELGVVPPIGKTILWRVAEETTILVCFPTPSQCGSPSLLSGVSSCCPPITLLFW